jgi:hypothetical protein
MANKELKDEALDILLNRSYQSGIAEGLHRAANHIMQAAKASFERFGTEERQTLRLRTLANELHSQSQSQRIQAKADPQEG